ncbi:hypothetical protein B0A49_08327 [Cryomyces minteri]|uniref:Uncharacterized protein n=1 Tax=Cryomyces minteri TaxID=331657 RepID=A0A4U0WHF0_9PEZI|nr:hypothetical protein B0A49_08327 [Cryomyces minteri]
MSSFFTTPASQRKRKRGDSATTPVPKKRNTTIPNARPRSDGGASTRERARRDDESISGSESEDEGRWRGADDGVEQSSESEYEDETAAERRVRLAESYIENIRREVVDEAGFDAADVDRDNIAARLKEDVAETKGRLYRRLASDLSFNTAAHTQFRADVQSYTGIATCPPYAYTVSKDMTLIKWEIQTPPTASDSDLSPTNGATTTTTVPPPPQQSRRRPKQLIFTKGNKNEAASPAYQHHTSSILCVAASADGRFVATGGQDRKLIIWAGATLSPLKVFSQHRDAVTSLAFRRGTNQLFSASADRTIKIWSLDELAYVDTLFGHQDAVVALAALGLERCVSVGARDRTARLWKVVEESQLVFRGGGSSVTRTNRGDGSSRPSSNNSNNNHNRGHAEGSIDAVVLIDDETFVTGSDNGALSLWSVHKKKPLFSVPATHGCDAPLAPDEASAERSPSPGVVGAPLPRWITALAGVPFSDVVVSGSWDGAVRAWRVSEDRRRLEALGPVGWLPPDDPDTPADPHADTDATLHQPPPASGELASASPHPQQQQQQQQQQQRQQHARVRGVINALSVFERGERGRDGLCIAVAVGKEHRLGRWIKVPRARNRGVVFEVRRRGAASGAGEGGTANGDGDEGAGEELAGA